MRYAGFGLLALVLCGAGALLLIGRNKAPAETGYRQISMQEAAAEMQQPAVLLVDVRTPEEYAAGHIPGAINLPNETIGTEPPAQLPDKAQTILVYCRSGNRSKDAAHKLAEQGYTGIVEIGGIRDWTGELSTD